MGKGFVIATVISVLFSLYIGMAMGLSGHSSAPYFQASLSLLFSLILIVYSLYNLFRNSVGKIAMSVISFVLSFASFVSIGLVFLDQKGWDSFLYANLMNLLTGQTLILILAGIIEILVIVWGIYLGRTNKA